jgi:hypothetical protein
MREWPVPRWTGRRPLPIRLLRRLFPRRQPKIVNGKIRRRARRYIPPEMELEPFFITLRDRGIRYVLLRWADDFPHVKPDGDIDLLIHDDDVDLISDLFVSDVRGVACDLFSVSGLVGTSYRGIPYLPPEKAGGVLARAGTFRDLILIPSPEDQFFSLAYHAVYQKGLRSGLPTSEPGLQPDPEPRHDYAGDLARRAADLRISVPITMESVDEYLAGHGWRPSQQMLASLAQRNPWVAARFNH